MKTYVRNFQRFAIFACAAAAVLFPIAPVLAQQAWRPDRNVELIVGSTPGSGQDKTARVIQRIWKDARLVETTSAVVNKVGGGGVIADTYVVQRAGDAHTLMTASPTLLTNHIAGRSKLNYTDFTPVALLFDEYIAFVVRPESPFKTGTELIAALKKNPASVSFGFGTSIGNANHISIALLAKALGIDAKEMKVVVFNSASDASIAVMGGHIDVVAATANTVATQIDGGKMRALAVAAPQRVGGVYAKVPVWREMKVDAVASSYRSIFGPKGFTPAQVAYWEAVFARVVEDASWKQEVESNLWVLHYVPGNAFRKLLEDEYASLAVVMGNLGLAKTGN